MGRDVGAETNEVHGSAEYEDEILVGDFGGCG